MLLEEMLMSTAFTFHTAPYKLSTDVITDLNACCPLPKRHRMSVCVNFVQKYLLRLHTELRLLLQPSGNQLTWWINTVHVHNTVFTTLVDKGMTEGL